VFFFSSLIHENKVCNDRRILDVPDDRMIKEIQREMQREMQIIASLAAGLRKEMDEMISKHKGTVHQTEENVDEPRGQPTQWGR
jgi:hypothetical protein